MVGLYLFHDLLLRYYLYHCVWSVTAAHNLTPEKRDTRIINCRPPIRINFAPGGGHRRKLRHESGGSWRALS